MNQDGVNKWVSQEFQVIPYSHSEQDPAKPRIRLPDKPQAEAVSTGIFGWFANKQSVSHDRRMTEIYHLGVEVAFAETMAVGVEVKGIKVISDTMELAEDIVYALPQQSVAGMVAADLAGDMASRVRSRHGRLMETYDSEAINVINRH